MVKYYKIKNFDGVFTRDTLPSKLLSNHSIIINLDSIYSGGTHWVSCYNDNNNVILFDSFGMTPSEEIQTFMKKISKNTYYTSNEIQNENSILCGYFAIAFILLKQLKYNTYDILYQFKNNNALSNDLIVINILKKNM